jgi:hypothetical protein
MNMKKISATLIIIPVLILLISCKKDRDIAPAFSAMGFWVGNFGVFEVMGVLNRPDGTSRFYSLTGNLDTTRAVTKYDGTYKVKGDIFTSDYFSGDGRLHLETSRTTSNSMTGVLILSNPSQNIGNAFSFVIVKQP